LFAQLFLFLSFSLLGLYDPGVLLCLNEQTLAVIPKPKMAKLKKKTTMSWTPPYSQVRFGVVDRHELGSEEENVLFE
jgi:hypothetical protein